MQEFKEAVKPHPDGVILNLSVTTDAEKPVFPAGYNPWRNHLVIKIRSPPKQNQANKEIIGILSAFFNKSVGDIIIVSGEKSREKKILIRDSIHIDIVKRLRKSFHGS
jgi:hypothetical protein